MNTQPKHLFGNYYYWFSTLPGICYGYIYSTTTRSGRVRIRDRRSQFKRVMPFIYKQVQPQGVWLDIRRKNDATYRVG